MSNGDWIEFSCIEVEQPIGTFYIGAMDSKDLVNISFTDRRRIERDEREIEVISGIQRPLSQKRVSELRRYVNNVDASFPTAIILSLSSEDAVFDPKRRTMSVRNASTVAKIIDGQHRIEGLAGYSGNPFQLNVTLFVDMDMEDQAMLFATINLKQTPVSKSLVYDLFEFANTRSPQKTCHNIARLLNSREESPFYRRIMILGTATDSGRETLTQAAFIDPLIRYLSVDPMADRDQLKRGITPELATPAQMRVNKLIFRNMFLQERDAEIAKTIWNYFAGVSQRWPDAWNTKQSGLVLNRTTGYRALMRFLPVALLSIARDSVVPIAEFKAIFDRVKLESDQFTPDNFKPGSSGQAALYKKLVLDSRLDDEFLGKVRPVVRA